MSKAPTLETCHERRGTAGVLEAGWALDPHQARDGQKGRVLIVDDDAVMRLLCAVNLTAEGLHVLEAEDGLEALEQARCERPDLILTDVKMPRLDGFQLAERLRGDDRTRRIPLIFLSGEVAQANAERAHELGALAYLTKPFDPGALASLVAREIDAVRAGSSDELAAH
jgi:CheY-like chemotaxis protein